MSSRIEVGRANRRFDFSLGIICDEDETPSHTYQLRGSYEVVSRIVIDTKTNRIKYIPYRELRDY